MYAICILESAEDDMVDHLSYVRRQWGDACADAAYETLMQKLTLLEVQPHLGSKVPELSSLGLTDFRVLVHQTHTKVLYEVDEPHQQIYIHMIFGSAQDFQTLLYKRIIGSK
jgi:plasmid stabilization system protein ParE